MDIGQNRRVDIGAEPLGSIRGILRVRYDEGFPEAGLRNPVYQIAVDRTAYSKGEEAGCVQILIDKFKNLFFSENISVRDYDNASRDIGSLWNGNGIFQRGGKFRSTAAILTVNQVNGIFNIFLSCVD